jgi:manganese/zinc/iron transport system ATP- binding protein
MRLFFFLVYCILRQHLFTALYIMNHTHAIITHHLTVLYGASVALDDVSVAIPTGVVCAVIGPNGAGKSTFLRAVLGLIKPLAGTVTIFNAPGKQVHQNIAYVPQRVSVDWNFPISVFDVVMMGRYKGGLFGGRYTAEDRVIVEQALASVGMREHTQKLIGELSGGQQQRVFLARALAQQKKIVILDEPFNGVDEATEKLCIALLKQLQKEGVTILVVHHDRAAVRNYADWVVMLRTQLVYAGPIAGLDAAEAPGALKPSPVISESAR